jgi:ABC-type nitrate/sulfonate/bicarbonate transport system substrate-binding protein
MSGISRLDRCTDSIIEGRPSLSKLIPAKLHYVPFEAGVTAIAEMKSGSVQAVSGVGNPPTTAAIGSGAGVTVVMGWGFEERFGQILATQGMVVVGGRGVEPLTSAL